MLKRILLNIEAKTRLKWVTVFLAGLLTTLGFSPFDLFPIPFITLAILVFYWMRCQRIRTAFALGFMFGLGFFGSGVSWVYISIQQFGGINPAIAVFLSLLFIAYLSLYPAICGYLIQRFFAKNDTVKLFFAFPFFWMLSTWVRSFFFGGFPWLMLGYSQTPFWLSGYATLLSVFLVTLLLLYLTAALVYSIGKSKKHWAMTAIVFVIIFVIGGILSAISWTHAKGKPLTVTLVQGNIPQSLKWSPQHLELSLKRYTSLTQKSWQSDVIIWPETAIPLPSTMLTHLFYQLTNDALKHHSSIVMGALVPANNTNHYYNGLVTLGNANGEYDKRRLVPFGEYLPNIVFLNRLYRYFNIPSPGLTPGPAQQHSVAIQKIPFSPFICYEIAFPTQVRSFSRNTDFIVTISDDAWFGHSIAPWQHLQMAQMRAIENGRMIAFASNSGITAFIDAHGNIIKYATPFAVKTLKGNIQPMIGKTPWQRGGLDIFFILMAIILGIAIKMKDSESKRLKHD